MQRKAERSWKGVMHKTHFDEGQVTNLKTRVNEKARHGIFYTTDTEYILDELALASQCLQKETNVHVGFKVSS